MLDKRCFIFKTNKSTRQNIITALLAAGTITVLLLTNITYSQTMSITGTGKQILSSGNTDAQELSGLTWVTDQLYYAVSDTNACIYPLYVSINPNSGEIVSGTLDFPTAMQSGSDLEGIAYNSISRTTVYVSDEAGPAVRENQFTDGLLIQSINIPAVYRNIRSNFGFESLSLQTDHRSLWTVNEEALTVDGPLSDIGVGTVVRLQKFDADLFPAGQWAYITDGITDDSPFIEGERSGVSDIVVVPDGRVLVLERELGGAGFFKFPEFRNRIYEVDFNGATDTTDIAALDGAAYTPVTKHKLWEGKFALDNFEGIALGKQLNDGSYSLLLISDDGGGLNQSLYGLRLYGIGPYIAHDPLIRGQVTNFYVESVNSNERVYFLYSINGEGAGPFVPHLGGLQIDLLTPITNFGSAVADELGNAILAIKIPDNAPLINVSFQAVVQRGGDNNHSDSIKTNAMTSRIHQ